MKIFDIFIDGSCLINPGPGGYGIIIKNYNNCKNIFISKGYYFTTNNRMELMSAIFSLKNIYIKNNNINIYTDSLYLKNGITKWIFIWINNNWKSCKKKKIKNIDLWIKLYNLSKLYIIKWNWIKKNSYYNNILCDNLAKKAAKNPTEIDKWYIKNNNKL
ncbi:ribonuclease H [endosymbiont of Euscepes postfasciatus]|uniref:RNase H family protein n=1 Tax=endosymbiont of Euscepes postfasciatus TaxID=650377 RepID=UPI000DC704ED|nr:RNase H family protein [endosymbiont of Euscepes postfasciatus]BBA84629.1 ribonuclease H [endosymbiont of Euscepes postfasciatus]